MLKAIHEITNLLQTQNTSYIDIKETKTGQKLVPYTKSIFFKLMQISLWSHKPDLNKTDQEPTRVQILTVVTMAEDLP